MCPEADRPHWHSAAPNALVGCASGVPVVQRLAVLSDIGLAVAKGASRRRSELSATPYPRPVRLPGPFFGLPTGTSEDSKKKVCSTNPPHPLSLLHLKCTQSSQPGLLLLAGNSCFLLFSCLGGPGGGRVWQFTVCACLLLGRCTMSVQYDLSFLPASLKDLESEQSLMEHALGPHGHGGRGKGGTPLKSADKVRGDGVSWYLLTCFSPEWLSFLVPCC